MKEHKKQNILAGFNLDNLDDNYISALVEQQTETKPSRINNKIFQNKKRSKKRQREEYNEE